MGRHHGGRYMNVIIKPYIVGGCYISMKEKKGFMGIVTRERRICYKVMDLIW